MKITEDLLKSLGWEERNKDYFVTIIQDGEQPIDIRLKKYDDPTKDCWRIQTGNLDEFIVGSFMVTDFEHVEKTKELTLQIVNGKEALLTPEVLEELGWKQTSPHKDVSYWCKKLLDGQISVIITKRFGKEGWFAEFRSISGRTQTTLVRSAVDLKKAINLFIEIGYSLKTEEI